MLTAEQKQKAIEKARIHEKDTGSPEAQIALLSDQIAKLVLHLKKHAKDIHSKRGLLKMVSKRKNLLKYLKNENEVRFNQITKKIGLGK